MISMNVLLAGSVAANIILAWYGYKATHMVKQLEQILVGVACGEYKVRKLDEEESGD